MDNSKAKILMVDDQKANLVALEAVLAAENYQLFTAESGEQALKFVLQHEFAVILLDVQMPGLSGYDTARLIKQRESSKHIPIIFVTALSKENEHLFQGYSAGAIDYIFKPFDPVILKNKVAALVDMYEKQKKIEVEKRQLEQRAIELELKYQNLEAVIHSKTRELVEADQELKMSKEHFRKIFQFSPNLMSIRSLVDRRFIDVNKSWCEHTSYTLEEINCLREKQQWIMSIKDEEQIADVPLDLIEDLNNEKVTYVTKKNEVRDGLLSTETALINGECCIISVITDITDTIKLEKQMSRLDRLNLVGEMAAGIAHEIRNPMTTVLGFLQLAKANEEKSTSSTYTNLMISELTRANSIITEYLSLAKDKATCKKQMELNNIIISLAPLLQAEAIMNGKTVKLALHDDCPQLFLDEKEIRQLILNIGLNGLEAMEIAGVLTISTYEQGDVVTLKIADEGPGMSEDVLEKIGTPFFTTKDKGTGLGLAICYSIASRHHADIEVATSKRGTTFSIHFPVTTGEEE